LSFLLRDDEAGFAQEIEVMGDGGPGHVESRGYFAGCHVFVPEHFQDGASGGVVQGFKEEVQKTFLFRYLDKYLNNFGNGQMKMDGQQQTGPGSTFDAWDCSTSVDFMPGQNLTFKVEYVHRKVNSMDLANSENRIMLALQVRF
jgi:hypothetical protein